MAAWLAPALAYIPQWFDYQITALGLPGASLAVAHDGRVALAHTIGVANLDTGEKLTPAHRFRVASHSKAFTAVAVMKLVEAGRLRLDDRAGQHVAGLHKDVARATIAQLLSHTAGITRDGDDIGQWSDRRPFLNEAELRAALAVAQPIPANTRMKYSNHGFGLAGLVIAAVTGESYNAWIAREIIAPAGLPHTTPDAPLAKRTPFARGHASPALLGKRFVIPADNPTHALAAATGFISTPSDLACFFGSLDPAAKSSILTVESRRELTRRHWHIPGLPADRHYGLGTSQADLGTWTTFGHGGGFQGVRTYTSAAIGQGLIVSVALHATDGEPNGLAENTLRILQTFATNGPAGKKIADWSGRFWSVWGPADFIPMASKILIAQPGQPNPFADATELTPTGPDTARITSATGYASYGQTGRLVRDKSGRVSEIILAGGRLTNQAAAIAEARERYGA